ncbi:hypothetical protein D3C79_982350 [compost metagenome]
MNEPEQDDLVRNHIIAEVHTGYADQIIQNHYTQALNADHHEKHIFGLLLGSLDHNIEHKAEADRTPGEQQSLQEAKIIGRYAYRDN